MLPFDEFDGVSLFTEKFLHGASEHDVALIFDPVDFDDLFHDDASRLDLMKMFEKRLELPNRLEDESSHGQGFRFHIFDVIGGKAVGHLFDGIHDVVHFTGDVIDVLSIERCHKGAV